ncbi:MAG: adenosylcobinamide-GDP ribazoletransferase [Gammaproteobacteria bacterium]
MDGGRHCRSRQAPGTRVTRQEAHDAVQGLRAALSFLTILPVSSEADFSPKAMMPFFPLVGLLLGLVVAVWDFLACRIWPLAIVAVLDVLLLAVLSGGLHLDGLADAADGLLGHHTRRRALEIMKDSRVGAMGLLAVVLCLALKAVALAELSSNRFLAILLVPAYARASMLWALRELPYGRPAGTAKAFFGAPFSDSAFLGLVVPGLLSLGLGVGTLVLHGVFLAFSFGMIWFYRHRIGCVTGDMLGAMSEISETVLFLALAGRLST